MYFPVFETEPAAGQIEKPPIPRGNGEHILFVDDEEVLTKLGTNILEQLGYVVTAFTSAKEALAAYQKTPALYDLVMTDLTMPLMDGVELARQMLLIKPDQPLIITTGYTGPSTSLKLEKLGFKEILGKPSDARSLAEAVHKKLHPAFLSAN
jgi:CheY-like chemotaxis protein